VPDLALIGGPANSVPGAIHDFGSLGTRAAIVFSSGFDLDTREATLAAAESHMLRVLGPDSAGLIVPELGLNASAARVAPRPGDVAFVSQSAAMLSAAAGFPHSHGNGFSCIVSLGGAADIDAADLLDYFSVDPGTRAIGLHVESIAVARKFMSAARAAARAKPVVVLKSGSSPQGAAAISRRTGDPLCRDDLFDSLVHRAGLLRVRTVRELFAALATFSRPGMPEDAELLILTNDSGAGTMAIDALVGHGHRVPSIPRDMGARIRSITGLRSVCNPLDIGRNATDGQYAAVLEILLASRTPAAVLVIHVPSAAVSARDVAIGCASMITDSSHIVLACWIGTECAADEPLRERRARCYETPEDAVQAFVQMARLASNQRALLEVASVPLQELRSGRAAARQIVTGALANGRHELSEREGRALLAAYGVPIMEGDRSRDAPGIRDDARGLRLALVDDALFGPTVELERYGRSAATPGMQAVEFAPMTFTLARDLMTRAGLSGGRDWPPSGTDALIRAIVQLSQLGAELREIARLEIDPLHLEEGGVVAVEIRCALSSGDAAVPPAIAPYPTELEQRLTLRGTEIMLRPIRPDDAHAYAELIRASDPAHVRYRFARLPRNIVPHEFARYTQVDYDREMAVVAVPAARHDDRAILGEVRVKIYRRSNTAEFSMLVRTDAQRGGLGRALLGKMIDYCVSRGLSELVGQILVENHPMIALARSVGMTVDEAPGGTIAVAHLDLKTRRSAPVGAPGFR
jgi:acyl-CoA synthetase (NDP forming)/RimJ/RimL family protein N-acetyltransferase